MPKNLKQKIINKKITENKTRELYNNLMKPGIVALENSTSIREQR